MTENEKYNIEDFWPGAEELLDQHFQKRGAWFRKRRLILIGLAFVVIGGFTALWFNVSSSGKVEAIKTNQISETSNYKTFSQTNDNTSSTKENSNALGNNAEFKNGSESITSQTNDNTNSTRDNLNAFGNNAEFKNGSESITSPINNGADIQGKSIEVDLNPNLLKTKQTENNLITKQKNIINSSQGQELTLINDTEVNNNVKTNKSKEDIISNLKKGSENIITNENLVLNQETEFKAKNSVVLETNALTRLNPMPAIIQPNIFIPSTLNNSVTNELLVDSYKNNRKSSQFFVKLGGGVNYVDKTLSSTNYPDYVSRRSKEESAALYSSFNLHVGFSKNLLRISTGVELNQYGENIKFNDWLLGDMEEIKSSISYITDSTLNTVTYYIQGNEFNQSNFSFETDTLMINDTTLFKGQVFNDLSKFSGRTMFSYVEIPLMFEYSIYRKRSFSISINSGLSLGFLRASKGYYLRPELNELVDLSNNNTIRKAIFSGRIGTSFHWEIGNKSSVFLSPEYRFNVQSVFNNPSGINQRFQTVGLQFGVMKRF